MYKEVIIQLPVSALSYRDTIFKLIVYTFIWKDTFQY